MINILLTGVAGFIGSNLAEKLIKDGNKIIGIDNFDIFYDKITKKQNLQNLQKSTNFKFYNSDLLNINDLSDIFKSNKIDIVIHLAAKAGVRPSISDPSGYFNVNLNGTLNLLEVMKANNIKKLIFASSSSVYGNNKTVPFSETDNVDFPISPYAASKKAGELLCHTYHHLYNFDIFCLRFFTVYGHRQRPDLAIHKFTKALLNNEVIPFYGDGNTRRDYTHISDIIKGIEGAIINLRGFEIINLGESQTTSLIQLIAYLEKFTGKNAILNKMPMQAGDVELTFANIDKARKMLKYNPNVNIEDGLKDFVCWYKQKMNIL
jgi:UDP-glucuronate 4-epimerase